ncbi:MAG: hypothetical protein NWF05_07430 [Candidatus Bathyarchaeota archaeon]|nr:hypothetical protein [Candidatus Bathyarchaeota archaeon]
MNKLTRIGIILIVIGIAILPAMLLKLNVPSNSFAVGGSAGVAPDSWTIYPDYLWSPQELKMNVNANSTIDLYILDGAGVQAWQTKNELKPLHSFLNITYQITTITIPYRGHYGILIHNNPASATAFTVSMVLFGLITDLLWSAIGFITAGLILIVAGYVRGRKKYS